VDLYIFHLINQFAGSWPLVDYLAIFFAKYFVYILVILVVVIFWKKWKIIFQSFFSAILARWGIVELIRFLWPRERPFVNNEVNLLFPYIEPSFPSGHAAFTFALATVIYYNNKKAGILFFIAGFLISLSRVFAGIHWPSDILAGAIVGIFSGWLIHKISNRFFKSKTPQ